jgi:ankyrin repeat protein
MHYYKILNHEENHNNVQYKTGLNVDVLPFKPSGNCEPGGIYFSREDILAFLNYGPWIRRVTLPEDAQIYENPGSPKKWKADKIILGRKYKINAKVIKRLLDEGADPKTGDSIALLWAAEKCHTEIVKLLIPVSDPKIDDSIALRWAAEKGNTEIVKMLIPVSDPKARNSYALRWAAENGHTEVVKLLIPVSDPKVVDKIKGAAPTLKGGDSL